jgi:hypothetical protein
MSPTFAVVGHPNKGKSSIVATLAEDDGVRISSDAGTTRAAHAYPMRVDDRLLYTLIDTPGFQRARAALEWMRAHETTADKRPEVVRAFVAAHAGAERFRDECELLGPIVAGAGILYVVDGARPFGREYEAEMEILRFCGQPSLGLINPIGAETHVEEWRRAMEQYFRIVRVFDAQHAPFARRMALLHAFGELDERWQAPLCEAVAALQAERDRRQRRAARTIADTAAELCTFTLTRQIVRGSVADADRDALQRAFLDVLRERELQGWRRVERIFQHHAFGVDGDALQFQALDLFSQESFVLWGLSAGQLAWTGAAGGAAVGGAIDLTVGGQSFLLGTAVGAAVGGMTAWLNRDRIASARVGPWSLGGRQLRIGPVQSPNFFYVVLGRALQHYAEVASRSHARRSAGHFAGTTRLPEALTALGGKWQRLREPWQKSDLLAPALEDTLRSMG